MKNLSQASKRALAMAVAAATIAFSVGAAALVAPPAAFAEPKRSQAYLPVSEERLNIPAYIVTEARRYGVNPATALRIAKCESGFNPLAKNPHSSASGIYQFTKGTWKYIGADGSPFDAKENIRQFMLHYPQRASWWACK